MPSLKQAMLLAAGLSTRMRPLTDNVPKPLVPFLGKRILDFTLQYLQTSGIERVCTNVHHGRDAYLAALKETSLPLKVQPFDEKPVILGTGGGIKNMKNFITDEHFAVVNCDFFTDVALRAAFMFHVQRKSMATMVLIETAEIKKYGGIGIDRNGRIVDFPYGKTPGGAVQSGVFSGIHLFHRDIFEQMPDQSIFDINKDVYSKIIECSGPAFGFLTKSRWLDVGEIPLYQNAQNELSSKKLSWM